MCQRPRYSSPSKQGGKAGRRLGWRTSLFRSSASDVARSRHAGHIHNSYNALNQRKRLAELFLPAEVYRWGGGLQKSRLERRSYLLAHVTSLRTTGRTCSFGTAAAADGAKASESSSGTLLCFCTQILKKDNHPPKPGHAQMVM